MRWTTALTCWLLSFLAAVEGGFCYRPTCRDTSYNPPPYYPPTSPYYPPPPPPPEYYPPVKEYVPYVLEVQVYKDRYYSLSDLYRDRLYLELFDTLREMKGKLADAGDPDVKASSPYGTSRAASAAGGAAPGLPAPGPRAANSPAVSAASAARARGAKTGAEAEKLLTSSCLPCHGRGNKHLDLSVLEEVSRRDRLAAFSTVVLRMMPKPPAAKKDKSEEENRKLLEDWLKENSWTDAQVQALHKEWVVRAPPDPPSPPGK